ncbi:MAG: hypothetical protein AAGA54_23530 [Myxococcota bacterium]
MTSFGLATALAIIASTPVFSSNAPVSAPSDEQLEVEAPELEWSDEGFSLMTGIAPGTTFGPRSFNPMVHYSAELGMRWERGETRLSIGAEGSLLQILEAKAPGGGVHGVLSVSGDHAYARAGLGVAAGIPGRHDDTDRSSARSAGVGLGLERVENEIRGRTGLDDNLSVDKASRVNNAVFLVLRLRFG